MIGTLSAPAGGGAATTPEHLQSVSAEEMETVIRQRRKRLFLRGIFLALLIGLAYALPGIEAPLIPSALLIAVLTPILVWRFPKLALYVPFAAACLFEMFPLGYRDSLTDQVPVFWNVNTIFQHYAHINLKGFPLNSLELFLIVAAIPSLVRAIYTRRVNIHLGELFLPIMAYMVFVFLGWLNGMATGGDFKDSLQEVRSQVYFAIAYLTAANLLTNRRDERALLWTMVLCVLFKGMLLTFRRFVTLAGQPLPDQGVGSHEEAFLFNAYIALLIALSLARANPRLRAVLWVGLPIILLANLACNRRAGTAAFAVLLPLLFLAAYRGLPDRRRLITIVALVLSVGLSIYYPMFKNSTSLIAQPARAIKSQFQPDERDASSNAYRDAENTDIMATIHASPWGYGYGKRFFHVAPIADISQVYEFWDLLPHNQILWVWLRVGTPGFLAFWLMITAILFRACRLLRRDDMDPEQKALCLFSLSTLVLLLMFGLLDLQLSNYRDMLFAGFAVGALCGRAYPRRAEAGSLPPGK